MKRVDVVLTGDSGASLVPLSLVQPAATIVQPAATLVRPAALRAGWLRAARPEGRE